MVWWGGVEELIQIHSNTWLNLQKPIRTLPIFLSYWHWWCRQVHWEQAGLPAEKIQKNISRISCCCYVIRGRGNFWREKLFWRVPPGIDIWRAFLSFFFNWRNFYILLKKMTSSYRFCAENWLKMIWSPPSRNWICTLSRRGKSRRLGNFQGLNFSRNFAAITLGSSQSSIIPHDSRWMALQIHDIKLRRCWPFSCLAASGYCPFVDGALSLLRSCNFYR